MFGKWSMSGVPKLGWYCTYVEDLGDLAETCEMCEMQSIRYVHYMVHENYPDELGCGCICAGKMEGDYKAAKKRESAAKAKTKRKTTWVGSKWRISAKGNPHKDLYHVHVTVFPYGGGYKISVKHKITEQVGFGPDIYPTEEAAKIAIYDLMEKKMAEWQQKQN